MSKHIRLSASLTDEEKASGKWVKLNRKARKIFAKMEANEREEHNVDVSKILQLENSIRAKRASLDEAVNKMPWWLRFYYWLKRNRL